jgi:monofunctional biosynthetic peptidoglycan transglycosylase
MPIHISAKKIGKLAGKVLLFLFLFSLLQVVVLKFVPVYYTPLIVYNKAKLLFSSEQVEHQWRPLEEISRNLPQAVVASEDNLFMEHSGFDLHQIEIARDEAEKGKRVRGASTISQQTAKNVFLWQGKSYLRKGLEAYYTVLIELIWGKKRIMEVYLNSIEMGENIYGAEAVARKHFGKSAASLNAGECALIAATLPNPVRFNSAKPSKYILRRKAKILDLMGKVSPVEFDKPKKKSKH